MGEYAEMMLDGTCCATCGEYLDGGEDGIPRYCSAACMPDDLKAIERPRSKHPGRNRRNRERRKRLAAARRAVQEARP